MIKFNHAKQFIILKVALFNAYALQEIRAKVWYNDIVFYSSNLLFLIFLNTPLTDRGTRIPAFENSCFTEMK